MRTIFHRLKFLASIREWYTGRPKQLHDFGRTVFGGGRLITRGRMIVSSTLQSCDVSY